MNVKDRMQQRIYDMKNLHKERSSPSGGGWRRADGR